ncbi:hypothetical protein R3P38DRAFT_3237206 [Favolaschia claudopus]|uniref:Uncharacterized protein n=1 Tax=Favolaschia claudopus TaxID=2862362 RepID=A0AAV9ZBD3_9AGAR
MRKNSDEGHPESTSALPNRRSRSQNIGEHSQKQAGGNTCTAAQLAAMTRYRDRNQSKLREKARERMSRRRADLAQDAEGKARYQERAREADARYRERNAGRLRSKQVDRRAMAYIQKYGAGSWLARDERRKKIAEHISRRAAPTIASPST